MLKEFFQSFFSWILYFAIISFNPAYFNAAIIVVLAVTIILSWSTLKKGFIVSWGTLIFFVFLFFSVIIFKNDWIKQHAWIFSSGTLVLIAWVSIVIRKPFTIQYAKQKVERELWQNPVFIRINYILTAVWGLVFLFNMFCHVLQLYLGHFGFFEAARDLSTIFAILFTARFPDWYVRRLPQDE